MNLNKFFLPYNLASGRYYAMQKIREFPVIDWNDFTVWSQSQDSKWY